MIDTKLIHFKTKENFMSANGVDGNLETPSSGSETDGNAEYGQIKGTSIVFIKDSKEIWTHGNLYKSVNWSVLEYPKVGDIIYLNDGIFAISPNKWNPSLGLAVGVVVIPKNFLPDNKLRFISLENAADSVKWGPNIDTELYNYNTVSQTFNNLETDQQFSSGEDVITKHFPVLLSTDNHFIGVTSYSDSETMYHNGSLELIPSPYYFDSSKINPRYIYNDQNNALIDFNGLNNTKILDNLGAEYSAAHAARYYNIAANKIDWYLPSIAELGVYMSRFEKVNKSIKIAGGSPVQTFGLWSSTECSATQAYYVGLSIGDIDCPGKDWEFGVRAFGIL